MEPIGPYALGTTFDNSHDNNHDDEQARRAHKREVFMNLIIIREHAENLVK